MSKLEAVKFRSEIARLVSGSVSEAYTTDFDDKPLVIKTGTDAGKPTQRYSFGVAYPKVPGKHWAESSELGALVWATGHAHMADHAAHKDFSWKVSDGDSTEVNRKKNRNCDNEGWPGHWIFHFSSTYAPETCNADGSALVPAEAIKRGHYVQVLGSVIGNESTGNPGVYLNHNAVAHSGFGPEIKGKGAVDVKAAGFGGALPAGASVVPVGGLAPPPAPAAPLPPRAAPPPVVPAPTPVTPSASFIAPPAAPPAPVAPPPPPSALVPVWKGPAGTTYEMFKAASWSDDQMRAAGHLA